MVYSRRITVTLKRAVHQTMASGSVWLAPPSFGSLWCTDLTFEIKLHLVHEWTTLSEPEFYQRTVSVTYVCKHSNVSQRCIHGQCRFSYLPSSCGFSFVQMYCHRPAGRVLLMLETRAPNKPAGQRPPSVSAASIMQFSTFTEAKSSGSSSCRLTA